MKQSARRCGDRVRGHDGPHDPHGDGDHDLGHLRDCGRDLGHLHGDDLIHVHDHPHFGHCFHQSSRLNPPLPLIPS